MCCEILCARRLAALPDDLDDVTSRLRARFGEEVLSASALVHGGREVVARQVARIRRLRPRTIVEIGTRYAAFAALLGRIAERVVTLDLHEAPVVPDVLECAGATNVVPIRVADNAAKGLLLDCLDFDLAFVDGNHERAGVAFDFAHVRRCGVVLFHDYADPGFHGVTEFVDSLAEGTVLRDAPFAWWFAPRREPSA
jgi:predicted O-methyltransferase YrrM